MVSPLTGVEALLLAGTGAVVGALVAARFVRWPSPAARLSGTTAVAFAASALAVSR